MTVKAGVPLVGEAEIELSFSFSHSWTYGTENSLQKTWTANFPIEVPGFKTYKAVAKVLSSKMDIPYTGAVHYSTTAVTSPISGIYYGVDMFDMVYSIEDITPT